MLISLTLLTLGPIKHRIPDDTSSSVCANAVTSPGRAVPLKQSDGECDRWDRTTEGRIDLASRRPADLTAANSEG